MDEIGLSETTAAWLERERGISTEVASQCGCVTVNGKLAFEYRRNGVLQYRKVRIETEDGKSFMRDRKGAETCLFLEHVLQTDPDLSSPLVICEGEIDALSLVQAGVANVVSVPDGAQLEEIGKGKIVPEDDKAFGWLWDENGLKPHLAQFERIVLATDSDKKGKVLREELAVRFERWRCDYVTYPEGCKDANEVLVRHGGAALLKAIEEAKPIVPSRLVSFGDIPERGTGEIFSSGFKGLDDGLKFGMVAPEFMVITGEPGSGKSEFAAVLGANMANYSGLPGAILQFEDRSVRVRDTLTRYAVTNVAGINNASDARVWVNRWFRTIEPEQNLNDNVDYDLAWLTATLREARVRHGCRWVIIDPWNELEHIWDRSQNEAAYTNDALRKLKRISRALQIILIVVAHPSKEGGRQKDITEMDLYGISGSAAWANKADHGIIIHRPDKAKQDVYVKVAKSKDHMLMGTPGIVRMQYWPASSQYKYVGMGV
jgi:twinkle protein